MYALHINDDLSVAQVYMCGYNDYLKRLRSDPTLKWVSRSGFLDYDNDTDFLTNPGNYIFLEGDTLWDGFIINAAIRSQTVAVPLQNTGTLGNDGGTFTVPDGVTCLAFSYLVASGADYASGVNGGCGSSISKIGFFVIPGQTVTITGLQGGRLQSLFPNLPGYSVNAATPTIVTIDGTTVLSLGGGVGGMDASKNTDLDNLPYSIPSSGAGGRWIMSPSKTMPVGGVSGLNIPDTVPSPYPAGYGGMSGHLAGAGAVQAVFTNSVPSGYTMYALTDEIFTNSEVPRNWSPLGAVAVTGDGPYGFGLVAQEEHVGVLISLSSGASGNAYGAYVSNLYIRVRAGTAIGGYVGANGGEDGIHSSGTDGQDSWVYLIPPPINGVAQDIIPIVYLQGASGHPDSTGVNSNTGNEPMDGLNGIWTIGVPSAVSPSYSGPVYQLHDGSDGQNDYGFVSMQLITESLEVSLQTETVGLPAGYFPIFDMDHYTPTYRYRAENPDPTWTASFSGDDGVHQTLQTAGWENYVEIVNLSSSGGAGSTTTQGGSGAQVQGVLYAIPPRSIVTLKLGLGGKFVADTDFQQNGDFTEMKVNGISVIKLTGGAGGATDPYATVPNFYPDWDDPRTPVYALASQGGMWMSRLTGTPLPVSYANNINIGTGVSAGGNTSQDGVNAQAVIRFHKTMPSGYTTAIPLTAQSISNTLYSFNDPNPAISTVSYTPGTYNITVPDGCYAMCINEITGGQGAGYADNNLSSYALTAYDGFLTEPAFVYGGAGGKLANAWTRVTPGQKVQVVIGTGGQGASTLNSDLTWTYGPVTPTTPNQPQGNPSHVTVYGNDGTGYVVAAADGGPGTPNILGVTTNYKSFASDTDTTTMWSCTPGDVIIHTGGTVSSDDKAEIWTYPPDSWFETPIATRPWACDGIDGRATLTFHPRMDADTTSYDPTAGMAPKVSKSLAAEFAEPIYGVYQLNEEDRDSFMLNTFVIPEGYNTLELLGAAAAGALNGDLNGYSGKGGQLAWAVPTGGQKISCNPGDTITLVCESDKDLTTNFKMVYTTNGGVSNVLFELSPGVGNTDGTVVQAHPAFASAKPVVQAGYYNYATSWGTLPLAGAACRCFIYSPYIATTATTGGNGAACIPACLTHVFLIQNQAAAGASWGVPGSISPSLPATTWATSAGAIFVLWPEVTSGSNSDPLLAPEAW